VKEPIEVIRHALPDSVVVEVTSLNIILVGQLQMKWFWQTRFLLLMRT
jgi:hypothetical protein